MFEVFKREGWGELIGKIPTLVVLLIFESISGVISDSHRFSKVAEYALLLGCAIFLVFLVALVEFIFSQINANRRDAKLKAFEGAWAQNVTIDQRPYSIALIYYDSKLRRWVYTGVGFDPQLSPASDWRTYSLGLENDKDGPQWFFAGRAHLRAFNPKLGLHARTGGGGNVMPMLRPPENPKGLIDGDVADIEVDGSHGSFHVTLRRVPADEAGNISSIDAILDLKPADVSRVLGKAKIHFLPPQPGDHTALPH